MKIEEITRAADAYLADSQGAHSSRFRFLKGVWEIQSAIESDAPAFDAPEVETATDALATGQPLFLVSAPEVPAGAYRDAVKRIAGHVAEHAGLDPSESASLRSADFDSALTAERLTNAPGHFEEFAASVTEALHPDDTAVECSTATIAFVLAAALVPFLTGASKAAIDALGDFDWAIWSSGDCPVCGSHAALGYMTESTSQQGAVRRLWCSTCHAEWGYERIRCARCGSRKQETLRYAYEESDPAHRLHLCDTCHGYLKVTLQSELDKPLSMIVEEAASMPLDAIARANGYTPAGDAAE